MANIKNRRFKAKVVAKKRLSKQIKANTKKRYTSAERKSVNKQLSELKSGKLTMNKHGGKKIKSKKQAIAKGLNIADSKGK